MDTRCQPRACPRPPDDTHDTHDIADMHDTKPRYTVYLSKTPALPLAGF